MKTPHLEAMRNITVYRKIANSFRTEEWSMSILISKKKIFQISTFYIMIKIHILKFKYIFFINYFIMTSIRIYINVSSYNFIKWTGQQVKQDGN